MDEAIEHRQQTFLRMADEFFMQYLISAHTAFRRKLLLSRLFCMGHSIELYVKSALLGIDPMPAAGHNVPELLARLDGALCLAAEEVAAGKTFFDARQTDFDLGLYFQHEEALELYQLGFEENPALKVV
jgi:hypothetical protein